MYGSAPGRLRWGSTISVVLPLLLHFPIEPRICQLWRSECPHEAACPSPNGLYRTDFRTAFKDFDQISGVNYFGGGNRKKLEV